MLTRNIGKGSRRAPAISQSRKLFYSALAIASFIGGKLLLHDVLGFGDSKMTRDLNNVLLYAFWISGFTIFVIQVTVWIETMIRRMPGRR